jgi:hypothetical protein
MVKLGMVRLHLGSGFQDGFLLFVRVGIDCCLTFNGSGALVRCFTYLVDYRVLTSNNRSDETAIVEAQQLPKEGDDFTNLQQRDTTDLSPANTCAHNHHSIDRDCFLIQSLGCGMTSLSRDLTHGIC